MKKYVAALAVTVVICSLLMSATAPERREMSSVYFEKGHTANNSTELPIRWFSINDSSCPIQLKEMGVRPYAGKIDYKVWVDGKATVVEDIRAFEVATITFDVWGEFQRYLKDTDVHETAAGTELKFSDERGHWSASHDEAVYCFGSLTFVKKVMLKDGTIWRYDPESVWSEVSQNLGLALEPEDLDEPESVSLNEFLSRLT